MTHNAIEDIYPLSPLQQGMLFHSLYAPEAGQHLLQITCTLEGAVELAHFEAAWQHVLDRQPALRTSFTWEELEEPLQVVHRSVSVPLTRRDWSHLTPEAQRREVASLLEEDRRRGFELGQTPLMRLLLARTGPRTHTFIWSCHHLLLDGWSLGLLLKECLDAYHALARGKPPARTVTRPYRDYIAWLKQQSVEQAEDFWRKQLAGFSAPTPLPVARATTGEGPSHGRSSLALSEETSERLRALARTHALTPNTLFQGAWALLLSRYSGQSDVVFGTTVAGRPASLEGSHSMVGMFINTLPVRTRVDPDALALSYLQQLQREQAEARQYEYSSLVQIHGWSEVPRGQNLFETLLVFESFPFSRAEPPPDGGATVTDVETHDFTNYTLDIDVVPGPAFTLVASYDRQRLDDATLKRLLEHYARLLEELARAPERRLREFSMLSDAELHQVLIDWNRQRADHPLDSSIQELIQEQVARTPDAIAVTHRANQLTYRELNARANQLAHPLITEGVGPDTVVALLGDRGVDFLAAIVGILKAGGAYLPLDPGHPAERLAQILGQSRTPVVVVSRERRALLDAALALLPAEARPRALEIPELLERRAPTDNPPRRSHGRDLAYVIYTSGSTGAPKGAMLEHAGKINHLRGMIDFLRMTPSDVMAQTASQCFDISVWQFLAPLLVGARVQILDTELARDPASFLSELDRTGITVLEVVPSLLTAMVEQLELMEPARLPMPSLRWIMPTGEVLPPALCRRWLKLYPRVPLLNAYGPTETSDDTNLYTVSQPPPENEERVPVGYSLPNLTMYILDPGLRPVPIGLAGELYIGGVGVGRGYLNDPVRTAAAFLPDPFSDVSGARFYKTGDICRYRPDGSIEFLDRADFQVKIRGYRVEPGEVEAVLTRHSAVKQAVVVARELPARGKQLVAYVVPREGAWPGAPGGDTHAHREGLTSLREFLQEHLPHYMMPSAFVVLSTLPLNANGKVDRKALPMPDAASSQESRALTPPRSNVEEQLVALWQEVLSREPIGVEDDFFELGGHSLLAVRAHSRLRELFGIDLPLRSLFELTTVARLAEKIEAIRWANSAPSGDEPEDVERDEVEL
ncbi:amino acid adenylation domain-containing protein [Archangium minus]|uniref:Amino acid adenylation domain-containing protein n=1 Tax=Archangium minus TaxID=83450 RepID=A0ABY9WNQ7_9BACT|nr:amino acid adenylation domain-containing protein [Archangium minus]